MLHLPQPATPKRRKRRRSRSKKRNRAPVPLSFGSDSFVPLYRLDDGGLNWEARLLLKAIER